MASHTGGRVAATAAATAADSVSVQRFLSHGARQQAGFDSLLAQLVDELAQLLQFVFLRTTQRIEQQLSTRINRIGNY